MDRAILWDTSCILCGLFWPAFISHYASHATDRISSIGDLVYNSNWIEYPPQLRKYAILIIARSQEPVYFWGLNLFRCTLHGFGFVSASLNLLVFITVFVGDLIIFPFLLPFYRSAEHLHPTILHLEQCHDAKIGFNKITHFKCYFHFW